MGFQPKQEPLHGPTPYPFVVREMEKRWKKRANEILTCAEICVHAPPSKKWHCIDCDMRVHDRAEPPKEAP